MQTKQIQILSLLVAIAICIIAPTIGYIKIGLPPVVIVGGSAAIGFLFWYFTYLKSPTDPKVILPLFLLTVAGLQIHIVEEYVTGFGPAMSRLFGIPWSERSFLMVFALIAPPIYSLTALGLYYRFPLAGFIAWFIFIGPGFAEFTHFIFPVIEPAIDPRNAENVTQAINGTAIADMPNYYYKTTGAYYFSGLWTALLPMLPGSYAIYRLVKERISSAERTTETITTIQKQTT